MRKDPGVTLMDTKTVGMHSGFELKINGSTSIFAVLTENCKTTERGGGKTPVRVGPVAHGTH